MGCTWLVYQLNEIQTGNGTVAIITTGKTYASGMFQIVNESNVIVCETDLSRSILGGEISDVDLALNFATVVCIGISIICLVIRIALQFCVSSFRNRPGRLQLQLTISFLIAFVMLIVRVFLSDFPETCTTCSNPSGLWIPSCLHLDEHHRLWTRGWSSGHLLHSSRADDEEKSLLIHIICGWGMPLLLVTSFHRHELHRCRRKI